MEVEEESSGLPFGGNSFDVYAWLAQISPSSEIDFSFYKPNGALSLFFMLRNKFVGLRHQKFSVKRTSLFRCKLSNMVERDEVGQTKVSPIP